MILNILLKECPHREMRGRSGCRNGGQAKQKSSGIPALCKFNQGMCIGTAMGLSGLVGDYRDPGTETPALGSKSLYCYGSGAIARGRVGREHGRGRAGMPGGIGSVGGGKFQLEEEPFRSTAGEGRRSRQGVGRRRFVGAKECAGPIGHITGMWWYPAVKKWGEGDFMP